MSEALFPPEFFAALGAVARRRARKAAGGAPFPVTGAAERGMDRRPWRAGDDRRAVDWRASARRSQLLVRERQPYRGGSLLIWLDRSASLTPQSSARDRAQRRLALAAGWLALERGALVRVRAGSGPERLFAGRFRRQALRGWLEDLAVPQGPDAAPRRLSRDPGCEILLLTDPWLRAAALLPAGRGPRVSASAQAVVLVLPEEEAPPQAALRLQEVEQGERLEVLVPARADWRPAWSAWLERMRAQLAERGFRARSLRCADAATLVREGERCGVL